VEFVRRLPLPEGTDAVPSEFVRVWRRGRHGGRPSRPGPAERPAYNSHKLLEKLCQLPRAGLEAEALARQRLRLGDDLFVKARLAEQARRQLSQFA